MVFPVGLNHPTPFDRAIYSQRLDKQIMKEFEDKNDEYLKQIINDYKNQSLIKRFFYHIIESMDISDELHKYNIAKEILEERVKSN